MKVSAIVPARNEAGRLEEVVESALRLTYISEVLIIEGGSVDSTWQVASMLMQKYPKNVIALKQSKTGKFNAVLEASCLSSGELILIWDADGTVSAQDNEKLIQIALASSSCVIGDRLKGEIFLKAMPRVNLLGNRLFAWMWIIPLGKDKNDLFCGSKIFPKRVFESVPEIFKRIDNYGDLSLITTARMMGLEIKSLPVNYYPRLYGVTNMRPWRTSVRFLITTLVSFLYLSAHKIEQTVVHLLKHSAKN